MRVPPISREEFLQLFQGCVPPTGWTKTIAVANSGGPDSTCLLFLINRHLQRVINNTGKHPQDVVSLTVDHGLQASSADMAAHCSKVAKSLGVQHIHARIPWSVPPFPKCPSAGQTFENTARLARYQVLFEAMTRTHAKILALGHHADDQVETSLMRLARGTTESGAGGMRKCRRWGMGMGHGEGSLGWTGYEGMNRWMIRPLLGISKDRILATCEANKLNYVTDKSNFQPELTLRNAIRHMVANHGNDSQAGRETLMKVMPPDIAEKLKKMERAVQTLQTVSMDVADGAAQLRGAVNVLTRRVEDIDGQVDSHLKRSGLTSPPGTYLLSGRALSTIREDSVRVGMILRIMRYVSFHPWGSIRADGNRRQTSLRQVIEKVWNPDPWRSGIKMFVAGGGVLWTPVLVRGSQIKTPNRAAAVGIAAGEINAWLASRQPPLHRDRMGALGMANPLNLDVTELLATAISAGLEGRENVDTLEVLYDCRFLVTFDLTRIPENIAETMKQPQGYEKILIEPHSRWYWPKVVWRKGEEVTVLASDIVDKKLGVLQMWGEQNLQDDDPRDYWKRVDDVVSADWIHIQWIRPLSAL